MGVQADLSKKNVLVTGAAGFIGSNFINEIATKQNDYRFIILDALTYAGDLKRIEPSLKKGCIEFVQGDIRDAKTVQSFFDGDQTSTDRTGAFIEAVIHFAAESHVDRSIENPNVFVETNVLGTMNLLNSSLKAYEKNKEFKFLHVSTDEVYGSLKEGEPAFTEGHLLKPNSPYSASKASSDLLVNSYFKTFGLPTMITRCSNNYGPFQNEEKLIPLMIHKALNDKKLPVYGNGKNIREWIHVFDHNEALWKVFEKGRKGEIYNIGSGQEARNIEIVEFILNELDKPKTLISYVEDRLGHDFRYAINPHKIETELGWKPKVKDWQSGLRQTIQWYKGLWKQQ